MICIFAKIRRVSYYSLSIETFRHVHLCCNTVNSRLIWRYLGLRISALPLQTPKVLLSPWGICAWNGKYRFVLTSRPSH